MKKILASLAALSLLAGCTQSMTVGPKEYESYGVFNKDKYKSDKMCYEVSVGNVIWSILLVETIVAPVYFVGFDLWEPVSCTNLDGKCGIDAE